MPRPNLPPGPLKALKDALHDLYAEANWPTMADLAQNARDWADRLDLRGIPSKDAINRILRSPSFPPNGHDVESLAAVLAHRLDRDTGAISQHVWRLWLASVTAPARRWVMAGPDDARSHFTARAQGYQGWVQGEDRFRGRRAAVEAVKGWLRRSEHPGRPLVITGQPGAGKSAVLARAVLDLEQDQATAGVAVHARNATVAHVVDGVAQAAGISGHLLPSDLIAGLKQDAKASHLLIAVDALDEVPDVATRRQIAGLLSELAGIRQVRVVVATRPLSAGDRYTILDAWLPRLGVPGPDSPNLVDLDSTRYLDPAGLRQFVTAVLTSPGTNLGSQYLNEPALTDRLADLIAGRAGSNFLVAALAATSLTARNAVVDPDAPGFDPASIPSTVGEAITKYLDQVGERRSSTLAMLTALAYARGNGVNHDRWLAFTTALGYEVGHHDLDDLCDSPAADYLLQTSDADDEPITRLFHQALIDDLLRRRAGRDRRDEESIVRTLLPTTATYRSPSITRPPLGLRNWDSCDRYTRLQLPSHGAAAGVLDDLVGDPGFLLTCLPAETLAHRHTLSTADGVAAVAALEGTTREWAAHPGEDRQWWLHVWARKTQATGLADEISRLRPDWRWTVTAALWSGITHQTLTSHAAAVIAVAALPRPGGNAHIISGSRDGTMRLWDPDTGEGLLEIAVGVSAVAALPDATGRYRILSGHTDGTVQITEPENGAVALRLLGHIGGVSAVAALPHPDGRHRIISGGGYKDRKVRSWDAETGELLLELSGHTGAVSSVAALPRPDGNVWIVSGSNDATVRIGDSTTGEPLGRLAGHTDRVSCVAALPRADDSVWVVSASSDKSVRVWDPSTGAMLFKLEDHNADVMSVAVLPRSDGEHRIISAGGHGDHSIRLWSPGTAEPVLQLPGHERGVLTVAALPRADHRAHIISAGDDGSVRIWDPDAADPGRPTSGHAGVVTALACLPNPGGADLLISGGDDGSVRVWHPGTGALLRVLDNVGPVSALIALPRPHHRAHYIVSGGAEDGLIRLWDSHSGRSLRSLARYDGAVSSLAVFVRDDGSSWIVSGGRSGSVQISHPETGEIWRRLAGHTGTVRSVVAVPRSEGGALIVSSGDDGVVRLWNPESGEVQHWATDDGSAVSSVTILPRPDGAFWVVGGSADGLVRAWDPGLGQLMRRFAGHGGGVTSVATLPHSADEAWILSANADGSVRIWDPESGEQVHQLSGHTGPVQSAIVLERPGGRHYVVTGGSDQAALVWAPALGFRTSTGRSGARGDPP